MGFVSQPASVSRSSPVCTHGPAPTGLRYHSHGQMTYQETSSLHETAKGISDVHSLGTVTRKFRGRDPRKILSKTDTASLVREVAREAYGESRSAAKALAEDSGQSPKAAENWLAGENPMGLTAFLNAYHNNPTFKAWARKVLLLEEELDPEFASELARFMQAVQRRGT